MVTANDILKINASVITQELEWLGQVLSCRLKLYFRQDCDFSSIWDIPPPDHTEANASYVRFIKHYRSSPAERLISMLALAPHIQPALLDVLSARHPGSGRAYTEFGGQKGVSHGGFLPTIETVLFLLAGSDPYMRAQALALLDPTHYLIKHRILTLLEPAPNEPHTGSGIGLSEDAVHQWWMGYSRRPHFGSGFPARQITTSMEWEDLVLPPQTLAQVEEIKVWLLHRHVLMNEWGFRKKLKPGYKCMFYGPPGTGKTLVACLIGKFCSMDVYRIDLSMVVSKYIGETEKNLEKVFDMAENKNWILFFDEADALFGKRSGVSDAHDRYANQETAYLLQRIEDFDGIVILATNLKNNIDEAFSRRFKSLIYFPIPESDERLKLWQHSFSPASQMEEDLDLKRLARKHELTGGMIMNVVSYSSLKALERKENIIRLVDIEKGIQNELGKEGRVL